MRLSKRQQGPKTEKTKARKQSTIFYPSILASTLNTSSASMSSIVSSSLASLLSRSRTLGSCSISCHTWRSHSSTLSFNRCIFHGGQCHTPATNMLRLIVLPTSSRRPRNARTIKTVAHHTASSPNARVKVCRIRYGPSGPGA